MFTVLFSDTSYNRLGVRLFSYPSPELNGKEPEEEEGPRNREPKKQEYRTEAVLIADLREAIDNAILWTGLLKNLEQANAHALSEWKDSLNEVKKEADELLEGLENLELPDDLKTHAEALSEKAEVLRNCLAQISPEDVQNILNSLTDLEPQDSNELEILPSLIEELPGKLEEVKDLLSMKLQ